MEQNSKTGKQTRRGHETKSFIEEKPVRWHRAVAAFVCNWGSLLGVSSGPKTRTVDEKDTFKEIARGFDHNG